MSSARHNATQKRFVQPSMGCGEHVYKSFFAWHLQVLPNVRKCSRSAAGCRSLDSRRLPLKLSSTFTHVRQADPWPGARTSPSGTGAVSQVLISWDLPTQGQLTSPTTTDKAIMKLYNTSSLSGSINIPSQHIHYCRLVMTRSK